MQVSDVNDKVTHASIGARQTQSMGISSSAEFFHVLSSSLYSDQKLAPVREVICNGDDAHKIIGCDKPLQITLKNNEFKVRDFGLGIPHDMIVEIYGTYGNSTKKKQSGQTGGFGLGSKSPFAYVDSFEVISYHAGKKTIYRMNKSDAEANGEPSIVTVLSLPSEETGIEVSFKVHEFDMHTFRKNVGKVVMQGDIYAELNDESLFTWKKPEDTDWAIINDHSLGHKGVFVRYGAVIYPIQTHSDYAGELAAALNGIEYITNGRTSGTSLLLFAPPDSISVAPSREQLSYTPLTNATIKSLLPPFASLVQNQVRKIIEQEQVELIQKIVAENQYMDYLRTRDTSRLRQFGAEPTGIVRSSLEQITAMARYSDSPALSSYSMEAKIWDEVVRTKKAHKAFHSVLKPKTRKVDLLSHGLRIMSSMYREGLHMSDLFITELRGWQHSYSTTGYYFDHNQFSKLRFNDHEYLELAQGTMVITHRKQTLHEDLVTFNRNNKRPFTVKTSFGLRVSRKKEDITAALAFAKRIGFEVIDLTQYQKLEPPVKKPRVPKPKDTRVFFKDTPEGMQYVSLANAVTYGGVWFDRVYSKSDPLMIYKPRCVVLIKSTEKYLDKYRTHIEGIGSSLSMQIAKLWGAYIAVVPTEKLYEQAISEGAKPLKEFALEQFRKEVAASNTFYAESAIDVNRIKKEHKLTDIWIPESLVHNLAAYKLGGFSGEVLKPSPRDAALWDIAWQMKHGWLEHNDPIFEGGKTVPIDKRYAKLCHKLATSTVADLIDFSQLDKLLDQEYVSDADLQKADTLMKFITKHSEKFQ